MKMYVGEWKKMDAGDEKRVFEAEDGLTLEGASRPIKIGGSMVTVGEDRICKGFATQDEAQTWLDRMNLREHPLPDGAQRHAVK